MSRGQPLNNIMTVNTATEWQVTVPYRLHHDSSRVLCDAVMYTLYMLAGGLKGISTGISHTQSHAGLLSGHLVHILFHSDTCRSKVEALAASPGTPVSLEKEWDVVCGCPRS